MYLIKKISLFLFPIFAFLFLIRLSTFPTSASQFDLSDKTSNGNNLTNHGATEWTTDFPFTGSTEAVKTAAASAQYLSAEDSSSLSMTNAVTLESWVKFDSTPSSGNVYSIVGKWDDQGSVNQRSYYMFLYNNGGTLSLIGAYSPDG